jgi:hypothetical protein
VRFGPGRESRDLLVPHVHPFDLGLAADRVGQPVQAVADDAIDPLHAGGGEGFCKLVSNCFGHDDLFPYDKPLGAAGINVPDLENRCRLAWHILSNVIVENGQRPQGSEAAPNGH